jgi:hypothetical protein
MGASEPEATDFALPWQPAVTSAEEKVKASKIFVRILVPL